MGPEDVIEVGSLLLSRSVYFEDADGGAIRPIFQRDNASGVRSYRIHPQGNSKDTHIEVFEAVELARYAREGFAIRCKLPSGNSSNRSINSKDIAGRLVVLPPDEAKRLPASLLRAVTAEHIWMAVQELLAGADASRFGPSTDYDLIATDGQRVPPKAVYGLAATSALGFEVGPKRFTAGLGTTCFEALTSAGFLIVPKGSAAHNPEPEISYEDRLWSEGSPKLKIHLHRERAPGLAKAKKAKFRSEHGSLFCERCLMDPVEVYGPELGDACIEVHHYQVKIADMAEGHKTRLDDLQCLCANCHRVVHQELKAVK